MTKKELRQLPTESLTDVNINYKDCFLYKNCATRLYYTSLL